MSDNNSYFITTKLKNGDSEAFRTLFRMHYPSLVCFVDGFVKDKKIAEDIVQNVFMRVWVYRGSLDETKPMRGYLFLLCRREVCSFFRKAVTLQRFVSGLEVEEVDALTQEYAVDQVELHELKRISEDIINNLPPKRKEVFILSRKDGLSINEIADHLGISPRTVNKHLELALRSLRECIINYNNEKL